MQIKSVGFFQNLIENGNLERVAYSVTTIDADTGKIIEMNQRKDIIVVDEKIKANLKAIREWLNDLENKPKELNV